MFVSQEYFKDHALKKQIEEIENVTGINFPKKDNELNKLAHKYNTTYIYYHFNHNKKSSVSLNRLRNKIIKAFSSKTKMITTKKTISSRNLDKKKETLLIKNIKCFLDENISSLKNEEKTIAIALIETYISENKQNLSLPTGVPPLPKPDSSGNSYPLYDPVKDKIHPYEFLQSHPYWSKMLTHFNQTIERDYLFQDQLQDLDESLFLSLKGKRQSMKRHMGIEMKDIIPPLSVRKTYELEEANNMNIKKAVGLNRLAYQRNKLK